jgi:outer membrane lipase/esterase
LAQREGQGTRSGDDQSPFGKLGVFANGTFTLGDKDRTSREAGFDFHTLGMTAGVDYRFKDNFILGAAFSFASTDADLDGSGGSMDAKQYSGSIYGTYYLSSSMLTVLRPLVGTPSIQSAISYTQPLSA